MNDQAQATGNGQRGLRRFSRHRFDARVQVSVFRDGLTITYWGRSNELGEDGIGATLSGELKEGEVVSLEFPVSVDPFVMKVRAIVRYSEGLRCCFEFLVTTSAQKLMLRQVCINLVNAN